MTPQTQVALETILSETTFADVVETLATLAFELETTSRRRCEDPRFADAWNLRANMLRDCAAELRNVRLVERKPAPPRMVTRKQADRFAQDVLAASGI